MNNIDRNDLLIKYVKLGNLKQIKLLFNDMSPTQKIINDALCDAVGNNHLEIVKFLIDKNAYVHTGDDWPIRLASQRGYLEIVKYLFECGADITSGAHYAVRFAAHNGHLETVKYLFENGADITALDNNAICYAANYGHLEVVKFLFENGANICAENNFAIKYATINNHFEIVKFLFENGASMYEAIYWSIKHNHLNIIKYFIDQCENDNNLIFLLNNTSDFNFDYNINLLDNIQILLWSIKLNQYYYFINHFNNEDEIYYYLFNNNKMFDDRFNSFIYSKRCIKNQYIYLETICTKT